MAASLKVKDFVAEDRMWRDVYAIENFESLINWDCKWGFLKKEYCNLYNVDLQTVAPAPNRQAEEVDKILRIKLPPIPHYPVGLEKWRKPPTSYSFVGYFQTKPNNPVRAACRRFEGISRPRRSMEYWGIMSGSND